MIDVATQEIIGSSRYHGYDAGRSEVEIGWTFLARKYWGGRYNGGFGGHQVHFVRRCQQKRQVCLLNHTLLLLAIDFVAWR